MPDKYVFLDRDGVINKDPAGWTEYGYVTRWEDFQFLPGVLEAIKRLSDAGYGVVIISNQQGVGLGYFSEEDLNDLTVKMSRQIEEAGGVIADIFYCTHCKEDECPCRKPKEGLFLMAQEELGIQSLEDKFYIGDTESDMQAGKKVGLRTILVLSGKSSREDAAGWDHKPDHICDDILEAARMIIS